MPGCEKNARARHLCNTHYNVVYQAGYRAGLRKAEERVNRPGVRPPRRRPCDLCGVLTLNQDWLDRCSECAKEPLPDLPTRVIPHRGRNGRKR